MVRHDNQKGRKQFPREHVDPPGTTARYGRNGLGRCSSGDAQPTQGQVIGTHGTCGRSQSGASY